MPLSDQPFDAMLLRTSPLYKKSRKHFFAQRGKLIPTLLSSPRSLSSVTLIENRVEYSPLGRELTWAIRDVRQKKTRAHFDILRTFTTNVFHEQNHRVLWRFLARAGWGCPTGARAAKQFLNFAESLIVILDFALGDQLGLRQGKTLYALGVIYSPGSNFLSRFRPSRRAYRNYLHAIQHAVFLRLEGMHPEDIPGVIYQVCSLEKKSVIEHALHRAFLLDALFVELTNPTWQRRNLQKVIRGLGPKNKARPLVLPYRRPFDHHQAYVITENWLEYFGL